MYRGRMPYLLVVLVVGRVHRVRRHDEGWGFCVLYLTNIMETWVHKKKGMLGFCCSVEIQKGANSKFGWTKTCLYIMTAKRTQSNSPHHTSSVVNRTTPDILQSHA